MRSPKVFGEKPRSSGSWYQLCWEAGSPNTVKCSAPDWKASRSSFFIGLYQLDYDCNLRFVLGADIDDHSTYDRNKDTSTPTHSCKCSGGPGCLDGENLMEIACTSSMSLTYILEVQTTHKQWGPIDKLALGQASPGPRQVSSPTYLLAIQKGQWEPDLRAENKL